MNDTKMAELVIMLKDVESSTQIVLDGTGYLTNGRLKDLPDAIRIIVESGLMEEVLINKDYTQNMKAKHNLDFLGYTTTGGKTDDSGFLHVGFIKTNRGKLVYG